MNNNAIIKLQYKIWVICGGKICANHAPSAMTKGKTLRDTGKSMPVKSPKR